MRFSKERIFLNSIGNFNVTITVRFSLLADLLCNLSPPVVQTWLWLSIIINLSYLFIYCVRIRHSKV